MARDRFNRRQRRFNERPLFGLLIIGAGVLILLRNLDFPFPDFLFTWPMILIGFALVLGVREGFRPGGWLSLLAVGGIFLAMQIYPELHLSIFFWPAILITVGLSFILGRRRIFNGRMIRHDDTVTDERPSVTTGGFADESVSDEVIDVAAVFGAVKKNIYAKNFKGGDVVTVFGGSEINLMQADFTNEIKIDVVNIFGGTTLFIPPHWQIRSDAVAVFGGIEDKRPRPAGVSADKVVILDGFVMMGGIDIKSK